MPRRKKGSEEKKSVVDRKYRQKWIKNFIARMKRRAKVIEKKEAKAIKVVADVQIEIAKLYEIMRAVQAI